MKIPYVLVLLQLLCVQLLSTQSLSVTRSLFFLSLPLYLVPSLSLFLSQHCLSLPLSSSSLWVHPCLMLTVGPFIENLPARCFESFNKAHFIVLPQNV